MAEARFCSYSTAGASCFLVSIAPASDHSTGNPSLSATSIHGSLPDSGQVMSGIGPTDNTATCRSTVCPWCSAITFTVEPISGS